MNARVNTLFDCKHEKTIEVELDDDVEIPDSVRGLGKCQQCAGHDHMIAVAGIAPSPGGRDVTLDSILMMPM